MSFAQYSNHYESNKFIEPTVRIGKHNYGGGAFVGYYFTDRFFVRGGGIFRKFDYKSYSENIIEGDLDANYVILENDYTSYYFSRYSIVGLAGFAAEKVKVTSETNIIDPYPSYMYAYVGGQVDVLLADNISLGLDFRQYYAINGSKDKLGVSRFDAGVSVKFHVFN